MSNLSISITDEDKQKISLAKDVTQKNIELLREYAITKPDAKMLLTILTTFLLTLHLKNCYPKCKV